jgi:hypothetical protein
MESSVNPFAVVVVSAYLCAVGVWLILTKRIPSPGFVRICRALARPPYAGTLSDFRHECGHCFLAPLPEGLLSDQEGASSLRLYEDGNEIGPARAAHVDIRAAGGGRFSHWGRELYFSTSDNSDPRTNGRAYTVREKRRWP